MALRIICGALLLPMPTSISGTSPLPWAFFPEGWLPDAQGVRGAGTALVWGVFTALAAWLAAAIMLVAAVSDLKVNTSWIWTQRGCEYPVFWCICAAVVAAHS